MAYSMFFTEIVSKPFCSVGSAELESVGVGVETSKAEFDGRGLFFEYWFSHRGVNDYNHPVGFPLF